MRLNHSCKYIHLICHYIIGILVVTMARAYEGKCSSRIYPYFLHIMHRTDQIAFVNANYIQFQRMVFMVSSWCQRDVLAKPQYIARAMHHYNDVIMTTMASQINSLTIVYSIVYSGADQSKHQSSASLSFVWGIHRSRWIPRTKGQ